MKGNVKILSIFMLLMIFSINVVLGQVNEAQYLEIENNSFIGSLSTNHLIVGVIILLIILIFMVWRLKRNEKE